MPDISFIKKLADVLPKLRTKLQLSGLAVIVTAYIATNIVPPERVKALIAAGSIGVVTLVFAQIFHFLKDFKEEERASLIFKLFVTFLVFILLLVGALAYLLVKPISLPERLGEGNLPTNVVVASLPFEILFFEARSHDTPGRPVNILQLCYEVRNADRVEINNNIGKVPEAGKHCIDVSVNHTTNYILTAIRGDQTVSKEVIVKPEKSDLPTQILSFSATPQYINADRIGEPIQLCYSLMNSKSARVEPGIGAVSVAKGEQCLSVNPKETTTYILSALGVQGYTSSKRVTVLVKHPLPEISAFGPNVANIVPGEEVKLDYRVNNAQHAQIDNGIGEIDTSPLKSREGNGYEENRYVLVRPQHSSVYTLTAIGFDGRKVRLRTFVTVGEIPPPVKIVDFTATLQRSKEEGYSVRLCYDAINASGVRLMATKLKPKDDPQYYESNTEKYLDPIGRHCFSDKPSETTKYSLIATKEGITKIQSSIIVQIKTSGHPSAQAVKITSFSLGRYKSNQLEVCYGLQNAVEASIHTVDAETKVDAKVKGCVWISMPPLYSRPRDDGEPVFEEARAHWLSRVTLFATGIDGEIVSRDIEIPVTYLKFPSARIKKFEASPSEIHQGQPTRLCYDVVNSLRGSIDHGVGYVIDARDQLSPGRSCQIVNPQATTTYTLTVVDWQLQPTRESTTVRVIPSAPIIYPPGRVKPPPATRPSEN